MVYKINIKKRAIKFLEQVDEPYYSSIKKAIYALANNPRPNGYIKLKGRLGYRIRIADYRVIYYIQDHLLIVEVIEIGMRKNIYE